MKPSLLYSGNAANGTAAASFVSRLLHAVTATHMLHLQSRSYAQHMALGDLYDGLQGKADELTEAYQGCTNQILSYPSESFAAPTDAVSYVSDLYSFIEGNRGMMGGESRIQNIVDEICSTVSTALYKLRFLG